ncbi:MAG: response regulator transcription factor [Lachnospiraceae bacterium]|nr:response regulator transcription factor [Lachnospiraceae bacterium]
MMKILLAEDETDLAEVVSAMLTHSGYSVDTVANGLEAVEKTKSDAYDAILLDVMMPVMDGLTAVKEIRKDGNTTPVLFLTAKTEVDDRIAGLDAGADDYLTKPFAMGELLARVRAMTRRHGQYTSSIVTLQDLTLDTSKSELTCRNSISLAVREARLMEQFMNHPGIAFSTEELLEKFWKNEDGADGEAVWMYISFLRNKLKSVGSSLVISGESGGAYVLTQGAAV